MKDYYKLLGISKIATQEEIKKAYRSKIKQYHPDLFSNENTEEQEKADKMTKNVNEAYDILSDQIKKTKYDNLLNNRKKPVPKNHKNKKTTRSKYTPEEIKKFLEIIQYNKNNEKIFFSFDDDIAMNINMDIHWEEKDLPVYRRTHLSWDYELIKTIAKVKPATIEELKLIKGITDDDVNRYGDRILNVLSFHLENSRKKIKDMERKIDELKEIGNILNISSQKNIRNMSVKELALGVFGYKIHFNDVEAHLEPSQMIEFIKELFSLSPDIDI